MILAGDIGGTKTVLALFERRGSRLERLREEAFASGEFGALEEILERFQGARPSTAIEAAGFGVAGTVVEGRTEPTNLDWAEVDAAKLAARLGIERCALLNDLEASAYGMLVLPESELIELNPRAVATPRANMAVVAAGTGLGEALLVWDGSRHLAVATEGGHADFAPRSDEEFGLLRFLGAELGGRVSIERVISGPGLFDIYRFLRAEAGGEPDWLAAELARRDPSAVVSEIGLAGRDPRCVRALELFASLYGAEAGNLALRSLARGGVFVAGGIAPRILPVLQQGSFLASFVDKGRFRALLERVPVRIATDPWAPVLGAAYRAAGLV